MRSRHRSSRQLALALAFALAASTGCMLDPYGGGSGGYGGYGGGGYGGYEPSRAELRAAQDRGYRRGESDAYSGRRPDYSRWSGEFDGATVRAFATGYRAGYERGQNLPGGGGLSSVPSWAVGTFRGTHPRTGDGVQVALLPDGRAQVWADDDRFGGTYANGYLRTRKGVFEVRRSKRGIRLVDVNDRRNAFGLTRID